MLVPILRTLERDAVILYLAVAKRQNSAVTRDCHVSSLGYQVWRREAESASIYRGAIRGDAEGVGCLVRGASVQMPHLRGDKRS